MRNLLSHLLFCGALAWASPARAVTVCNSFDPSVIAFYGGNSNGQALDATGHGNTLSILGTVGNPSAGAPEGDRWLGSGFSASAPANYLQVPLSAWPGSSTGAVDLLLQYQVPIHVQEQVFIADIGLSNQMSLYLTSAGAIGIDYNNPVVNFTAVDGMVVGQVYELRVEWGAFGVRLKINGTVVGSNSTLFSIGPLNEIVVGVFPALGNNRNLQSLVDALAFIGDPSIAPCSPSTQTPTPSPTLTVSPSATQSPVDSPSATASPSSSVTPTFSSTDPLSPSDTVTASPSPSPSSSPTPSSTVTAKPSASPSITPTVAPSVAFQAAAVRPGKVFSYPNPFKLGGGRLCRIRFAPDTNVKIELYDIAGRRVNQLLDNQIDGVDGIAYWDGSLYNGAAAAPGLYLLLLRGDNGILSTKLTVTR
jgi:hypothetical protein